MPEIAVFDFLSHALMHHPFNEGYLLTLRAGFPDDRIVFHARQDHIDQLAPRFAAADRIEFRPCLPFAVPFGLSRHNPLGGRLAARRCWQAARRAIAGRELRLVALLGADANLHAVFAARWPAFSSAPLHLILHNHLAEAMRWRSRNPIVRAFDFRTVMQRPLAPNVRLIALELGIRDAIADVAPGLAPSVGTLEHPVLVSEWMAESPAPRDGAPLRIAFVGHASIDKGFDLFAAWARRFAGPAMEFHAIGVAAPEVAAMDLGGLTRRPAARPESRPTYVAALAVCDLVCLPLPTGYEYVASGSVIDAIAALKPLACLGNRSLDAIAARYGAIGYMANSKDDLAGFIAALTPATFAARRDEWIGSLRGLREARSPQALGPRYAAMIAGAAP